MDIKVEVIGLEGVEDALREAGPKLAKRSLRKALTKAAEPLVAAAKSRAPVLTKATTQRRPGQLRDSIKMGAVKMSPKDESGRVRIGPEYKKSDGRQSPGVWGMLVEFGSVHGTAQPYLRPAFDSTKQESLDEFTDEMRAGVESLKR